MLETSARLLRLLSLMQARRDWTGNELASRLDVTLRTVRRDVDRLRDLGYPVTSTPGAAGGYRLEAGAAMPPLLLDDDEAVAVAVGLRTAATGTIAGIEETSVRALAKLEQILPSRLRRRVNALGSTTVSLAGRGPTVDAALLTSLATACRDRESLRLRYTSADGTHTRRLVEPVRLACTGRRWYLLAWDREAADWRTFRVDRIAGTPAPGPRFPPREPPERDVAGYISRAISSAPYRYRATIRLHAPAHLAAERVTPASGLVEAVDEDSCLLHVGGPTLADFPVHVAQLGFEFEVLSPPELVEQVRVLAGLFGRAAGRT
ncbi:helix-turn-helix transcriptional regulator [Actinophytocola sp.]|uniref:helix-turn-helix transcriptional regulator n=1 Tax=Actinophytocola sp. TaxID=1872138 RepID=UPI003D6B9ED6